MLIISRKKDEKIIVADNIEVTILDVGRNRVRFGVNAPKDIIIQTRLELLSQKSGAADVFMTDDAGQEIPAVRGSVRSA
jgi:carbon storage regulator